MMDKQALKKNRGQAKFMNTKAMKRHAKHVAYTKDMQGRQAEVNKAVDILHRGGPALGLNPEQMRTGYGQAAAQQLKIDNLKEALRQEAKAGRFSRQLLRRTVPRTALAAGAMGAMGAGLYGLHQLNRKAQQPAASAGPDMQPLKRNKVMDAIYRVFNIEPNLPAFEPVKQSTDNLSTAGVNPLISCWAQGFDKYCNDHGIDSVELMAALMPEPAVKAAAPKVPEQMKGLMKQLNDMLSRARKLKYAKPAAQ